MRRVEVERHLVAVLRRDPVAELLVERLADLVERLDPLPRVLREVGDAGHVVDRLRRVVELLVELRQRVERGDVVLVEIDDVLVGVDGLLVVLDFVGVHLRDGAVDLHLRLALERRGDVAVVRVDEIEPLPQLAVAALEREVRLLVVRVDLEDLLEALRRDVRLEEVLLLQLRQVHEDLDPLALRLDDVELALEHLRRDPATGSVARRPARARAAPGGSTRRRPEPRGKPATRGADRRGSSRRAPRS